MEESIIEEIFRENAVATKVECTFKYNFFLFVLFILRHFMSLFRTIIFFAFVEWMCFHPPDLTR